MPDAISIHITGLDRLEANLDRFQREIAGGMSAASRQVADEILNSDGLRKYPPTTAANQPPVPYYIRGRGVQTKTGNRNNSERYGTQFYVKRAGYTTTIGNRASYAPYLGGDEQARAMERIGWRKLFEVATEKIPQITQIFQAWVDRTIRTLGL